MGEEEGGQHRPEDEKRERDKEGKRSNSPRHDIKVLFIPFPLIELCVCLLYTSLVLT